MSLERKELKDKKYTDLAMSLRDLATRDWDTFYDLMGEEAMQAAMICMLRQQNLSLTQIAAKFNITKRKVQLIHEGKCQCIISNKKAKDNSIT